MGAVGALLVVLLTYVLPRIVGLYPAGHELPFETRAVLAVSRFATGHAAVLGAAAAALALAASCAWARPGGRRLAHAALLTVPRLGRLAREIATARFAATAGILQAAGCDALTMLDVAGRTCGNAAMAAGFARTGARVRRGATIAESLAQERFADPLLVQMVHVGESAGELEGCLARVAAYYDQEVPRTLARMTALFEPALLVGAGALVAFVLLAALLPIFELYGAVG
jgi:type II secretory pathway component PulF